MFEKEKAINFFRDLVIWKPALFLTDLTFRGTETMEV